MFYNFLTIYCSCVAIFANNNSNNNSTSNSTNNSRSVSSSSDQGSPRQPSNNDGRAASPRTIRGRANVNNEEGSDKSQSVMNKARDAKNDAQMQKMLSTYKREIERK